MSRFSEGVASISLRPVFAMTASVILKIAVPLLARVAGDSDPNEKSIFHTFGQASICVAMDFPGWMEAASTMFFLTGCIDCWVVVSTCRHYNEEQGRESWSPLLCIFAAFTMICFQGLFPVAVWNPTKSHEGLTVFLHTMAYAMGRFGYTSFVLFLMVPLKPSMDWKYFMKFYALGILWNFVIAAALVRTFWTFSVLLSSGANTLEEQAANVDEMPFKRYPHTKFFEGSSVALLILTLLFHQLGWAGSVEKSSQSNPEATAIPNVES